MLKNDTEQRFDARLFCENPPLVAPEVFDAHPVSELASWIKGSPDACVIYHWCDGWSAFDSQFARLPARRIVRWHNNTPPWFFAPYSTQAAANTLRGLSSIRRLIAETDVEFWANSAYSAGQLRLFGAPDVRVHVVHPMSPLLMASDSDIAGIRARTSKTVSRTEDGTIRLLFVGRFVPHKGHKHLVATTAHVQAVTGRPVELHLVGRADRAMQGYVDETLRLATQLGVNLINHGEASNEALHQLYCTADVFLFMSEHEGFGLPVLEAMRFGLPVVGWRSTAVGEQLARHPLAVSRLDHEAAALRVAAALQQPLRATAIWWQKQQVLSHYSEAALARRVLDGLTGNGEQTAPDPSEPNAAADPVLQRLTGIALETLAGTPRLGPELAAITRCLPADAPNRLVTLHDLASFDMLLHAANDGGSDLYKVTWRTGFPKKRRLLSRMFRHLRRAAFSLNLGLVRAIEQLGRHNEARMVRLADEVESLKQQNALILEHLKTLSAEQRAAAEQEAELPRVAARLFTPSPRRQNVALHTTNTHAPAAESSSTLSA